MADQPLHLVPDDIRDDRMFLPGLGQAMGIDTLSVQMQEAFRCLADEPPTPHLGTEHRPDPTLVQQ